MPVKITKDLAYAAGMDEGNRSMHSAGRKIWDEHDYQTACDTFNRLWPKCVHRIEPGECYICEPAPKRF